MNFQRWFKKAEEDEFAGRVILESKQFPAPACFHFQQMAEKYLKGLLVFHNKPFSKSHDLLELETLLLDVEPEINKVHVELEFLNPYSIETRYPGNYPEVTLDEAQKAYDSALKVKGFVLDKTKGGD